MLGAHHDLGASLYQGWSDEQRLEEIQKLVAGFRSGLPVGILCKMVETIAGSREAARDHLLSLLSREERSAALAAATGGMKPLLEFYLQGEESASV